MNKLTTETLNELPELDLIRSSYESDMIELSEKLFSIEEGQSIASVMVPEEMHESFRKRFEIHHKMQECTNRIKLHIVEYYIPPDDGKTPRYWLDIDVPMSLHSMLSDRYDENWDYDSRIEVFENLRSHIEHNFSDQKFIGKVEKKCNNKVAQINMENDEAGKLFVRIFFGEMNVSLLR